MLHVALGGVEAIYPYLCLLTNENLFKYLKSVDIFYILKSN